MIINEAIRKYIKRKGKRFIPALLPKGIPRGRIGDCYDTCALIALHHRELRYVEGYARDPRGSGWILHAWLTDAAGKKAYDPTWKAFDNEHKEIPVPTIYHGIIVELEPLARFLIKSAYKSILANAWRAPHLAREAMPGVPTIKP